VIPSINCFSLFLIVVILFEPVEKILSEKLDELKGAEATYSQALTLCQAKVEEFQMFVHSGEYSYICCR
jgi:hypothetical protein